MEFAYDAECRAPPGRREGARVAVGQDAQRPVGAHLFEQPVGTVGTHRPVGLDVLALDGDGLFEDGVQALVEAGHHAVHAHHQVDGGRPGLPDAGDGGPYLVRRPSLALALHQSERDAVRAGRTDRGSTAHHEPLDRVDQSVHIADSHRLVAMRKQRLVDEREAVSGPVDGTQFLGHIGTLLMFRWCPATVHDLVEP